MRGGRGRAAAPLAAALLLAAAPLLAAASPAPAGALDLAGAPPGAAACSGCHAPGGRGAVPDIRGQPAEAIEAALAAFRDGSRPATIMNRIAPGFTAAESRAIAAWYAGR